MKRVGRHAWHWGTLLWSPHTDWLPGFCRPVHRTISDTKRMAGHWTLLSTPLQTCSLTWVRNAATAETQCGEQTPSTARPRPPVWARSEADRQAVTPCATHFCQHSQAPHTEASFGHTSESERGHQAHLPSLQVMAKARAPMVIGGPDTTPQKRLCSWEREEY